MNPGDIAGPAAVTSPVEDTIPIAAATPREAATVATTRVFFVRREKRAFIWCPLELDVLIPSPRIIARMPVFKKDDLPYLVRSQMLFPRRHDGGPWETFPGKIQSTLGNAPKYECLLKLSDGPW